MGDVIEASTLHLEATYVHADENLSKVQWFGAKEKEIPDTNFDEKTLGWISFGEETTEKVSLLVV